MEKAIVLSDIHFDSADERHVSLMERFMSSYLKPETIFLNGDIIDLPAVSRYTKRPDTPSLKDDVNRTKSFLKKLRHDNPRSRIIYVEGNHEFRLQSYILEQAPELFEYVSLPEILGLKDLRIEYVSGQYKANWIKHHNLYVGHYDSVKKEAGATASHIMREKGVSIIQGHVHRIGMTAKRFLDRTNYGYENPCLAKYDVDYAADVNWMSGATVIYFDKGEHWAYPISIKDNKFVFEGKVFK